MLKGVKAAICPSDLSCAAVFHCIADFAVQHKRYDTAWLDIGAIRTGNVMGTYCWITVNVLAHRDVCTLIAGSWYVFFLFESGIYKVVTL